MRSEPPELRERMTKSKKGAPSRTVVISVDCVNAALLDQWSADGRLPNLSRLRARGSVSRLHALSSSVEGDWHIFYSGRQVSEHGHTGYDEIVPGTYRSAITVAPRSIVPPFWEALSDAGQRVVVFNPVHVQPPEHINGIMVTDWLVHDAGHYAVLATRPKSVAARIKARYPDDPVNPNDWGNTGNPNAERLLAAKRETLRRKVEFLSELLGSEPWDFLYAGFDEAHELAHLFWHLYDREHPGHPENGSGGDPLAAMLGDLDAAVGRLAAIAGEDAELFVVSISGIGPNYHWSHLVDAVLQRLEDDRPSATQTRYRALRSAWNRLPHAIQRPLHAVRHHLRERLLARDRRNRRAFALPLNERAGAVRLNLVGREPNGTVNPVDYDATCAELTEVFEALVCAETGIPLARRVLRTRELLEGPFLDRLPDLMIEWNVDRPIMIATSPRTGPIGRTFTDARTGHHLNDGIVFRIGRKRPSDSDPETIDLADLGRQVLAAALDRAVHRDG